MEQISTPSPLLLAWDRLPVEPTDPEYPGLMAEAAALGLRDALPVRDCTTGLVSFE